MVVHVKCIISNSLYNNSKKEEIEWSSTGTAIERLLSSPNEDRTKNLQEKLKGIKLNKGMFQVLDTDFGIRINMADSECFATFSQKGKHLPIFH